MGIDAFDPEGWIFKIAVAFFILIVALASVPGGWWGFRFGLEHGGPAGALAGIAIGAVGAAILTAIVVGILEAGILFLIMISPYLVSGAICIGALGAILGVFLGGSPGAKIGGLIGAGVGAIVGLWAAVSD